MTGRIEGLTKNNMDAVVAQDVIVSHCVVHRENVCTNVLTFADAIKNVVQCVNYITAQRINQRQFKALLKYPDCGYPDVVYFSAACWLSKADTSERFWSMR